MLLVNIKAVSNHQMWSTHWCQSSLDIHSDWWNIKLFYIRRKKDRKTQLSNFTNFPDKETTIAKNPLFSNEVLVSINNGVEKYDKERQSKFWAFVANDHQEIRKNNELREKSIYVVHTLTTCMNAVTFWRRLLRIEKSSFAKANCVMGV